MHAIWAWLLAGSPPHYVYAGAVAIMLLEDMIARSRLKSNSTIQLVFALLERAPVIGPLVQKMKMGPPTVQDVSKLPDPPGASMRAFLPFFFLAGSLVLFGVAVASCATLTPAQRAEGSAYGSCMEGKGLDAAASEWNKLPGQVDGVLVAPDTKQAAVGALEGLAGQIIAQGAWDAVICAVSAWKAGHPLPAGAAASPHLLVAHAAVDEFIQKHASGAPHAGTPSSGGITLDSTTMTFGRKVAWSTVANTNILPDEEAPDPAVVEPDTNPTEGAASKPMLVIKANHRSAGDFRLLIGSWDGSILASVDDAGRIHIPEKTTRRQLVKAMITASDQWMRQSKRDYANLQEALSIIREYQALGKLPGSATR